MSQKNRTLEGKNRTLGGEGGLKIVENRRTSFMHVPLGYLFCENVSFFCKTYHRLNKLMLGLRITVFLGSNKKVTSVQCTYLRNAVFKECAKFWLSYMYLPDLSNSIIANFSKVGTKYITDQISATSQP